MNTVKTMVSQRTVSHKFYPFVTISTPIDADFQSQSNDPIFIENGWKLTTMLYKYFRWLKIHQIAVYFPSSAVPTFLQMAVKRRKRQPGKNFRKPCY
jgi:hypothetical protein